MKFVSVKPLKNFIMNNHFLKATALLLALIIISCESSANHEYSGDEQYYSEEATESVQFSEDESQKTPMSSGAAEYQNENRKFVRTADISMEVKNVYQSTTKIESKLRSLGGFVEESNLKSNVFSTETFAISSDSAVELKKYTISNYMKVRVPQQELSSFLISVGDEIEFLNYRNISADDISLNLAFSEMKQQRLKQTQKRLDDLSTENGKTEQKQNVISEIDNKQEIENKEKINQLALNDKVEFSAVELLITEKEKVAKTMVVNIKDIDNNYRPGFWLSVSNSLKGGLDIFKSFLLGLLYIWPFFVIGGLIVLFYRQIKNKSFSSK